MIRIMAGQWTMSGQNGILPGQKISLAGHDDWSCTLSFQILTCKSQILSLRKNTSQRENYTTISLIFPNILTSQLRDKTEHKFLWPDIMPGHHPKNY